MSTSFTAPIHLTLNFSPFPTDQVMSLFDLRFFVKPCNKFVSMDALVSIHKESKETLSKWDWKHTWAKGIPYNFFCCSSVSWIYNNLLCHALFSIKMAEYLLFNGRIHCQNFIACGNYQGYPYYGAWISYDFYFSYFFKVQESQLYYDSSFLLLEHRWCSIIYNHLSLWAL